MVQMKARTDRPSLIRHALQWSWEWNVAVVVTYTRDDGTHLDGCV